jgi:hypothetical protein
LLRKERTLTHEDIHGKEYPFFYPHCDFIELYYCTKYYFPLNKPTVICSYDNMGMADITEVLIQMQTLILFRKVNKSVIIKLDSEGIIQ